jgi:hypothetical protein
MRRLNLKNSKKSNHSSNHIAASQTQLGKWVHLHSISKAAGKFQMGNKRCNINSEVMCCQVLPENFMEN